jgi:hypothetical protein
MRALLAAALAALAAFFPAAAASPPPAYEGLIFDAHLHYNDEAVGHYSIGTVMELFSKSGVKAILANSRPNDGTRALYEANRKSPRAGFTVVPFIRVYRDRADYGTWHSNPEIARMIEEEAKRGYYRGVGEFHLFARYPMLWGELSYRWDVTDEGRLVPAWKAFFTKHAGRFLVGSDTWMNQRWQTYPETMGHYRRWLGELPPEVAARIAWGNGARLFGVQPAAGR